MRGSIQAGNKLFPKRNRPDTRAFYAALHRKPTGRTEVKSLFKLVIESFINAQARRARATLVQTLDERTLRDIGLETEANQARDRSRYGFLRFGMY
jgi:hypothetical protein